MFRQPCALNAQRHARLRLRAGSGFAHAAGLHMAALMQPELVRAGAIYPIVFVEDRDNDTFRPMALLGLQPGENVFVDAAGRWCASYIPAVVRAYPFALARAHRPDRFTVCIDAGSELFSDTEGTPLFDAAELPTAALEAAQAHLGELWRLQRQTDAFVRALAERNLFTPLTVRVLRGGQALEVAGAYVVNEQRLDGLSDERLFALRRQGWLGSIYAHLGSLLQMERLEAAPERAHGGR
ncbi:SapC family protein [Azohydromonas australica]|uniref:SapC family protein n=1 Tax=Azohydromonas australica TaxID=364039 RepID=UPI0003FD8B5D|nr:SapC family protein [Azohydromonas australica]